MEPYMSTPLLPLGVLPCCYWLIYLRCMLRLATGEYQK